MSKNVGLSESRTSQGSIERYHRTLMGQVRTLLQQVTTKYNLKLSVQHPILPWIVRHAAWLLNRYAIHNDGQTSYQRRWQKDHKAPLCEMAETIQYMISTARTLPKMEPRFFKGIWLGRDSDRRINDRNSRQNHQGENHSKTNWTRQIRQATPGYNQCVSMELTNTANGDITTTTFTSQPTSKQLRHWYTNWHPNDWDKHTNTTSRNTISTTSISTTTTNRLHNGNSTVGNFTNKHHKTSIAFTTWQKTARRANRSSWAKTIENSAILSSS